jgi:hypothetical protein
MEATFADAVVDALDLQAAQSAMASMDVDEELKNGVEMAMSLFFEEMSLFF